jgi:hypothetical protein
MPRCPNGTRKNKRTGSCENKNTTRKKQLETRLKTCLDNIKKVKDWKTLAEQKRYYKLMSKYRNLNNEIENLDTNKHLTNDEVSDIMQPYNIDKKDQAEIKRKLMGLSYDPKYISCYTGKKSLNLYHMADDKLACYFKYGDEI